MDATRQRLRDAAERLALTLSQGSMQKTPARVLTTLLYSQQDSMTAAEICEELSISSGAVSTAVNQLIPYGLIERVPTPPGSRREHYRFRQGAWANLMSQQNAILTTMRSSAQEGLDVVTEDGVTGSRLREMRDFYAYMTDQLLPLIEDWRQQYQNERG